MFRAVIVLSLPFLHLCTFTDRCLILLLQNKNLELNYDSIMTSTMCKLPVEEVHRFVRLYVAYIGTGNQEHGTWLFHVPGTWLFHVPGTWLCLHSFIVY